MANSSRSTNSMKNMVVNLGLYGLTYIAVFVSRTIFVHILGNEYLSISGLFTNVITLLSFSELGLGTASVYCLYKPIAEGNTKLINSFLGYFEKLYKRIAIVTLLLGGLLIPGLPYIVHLEQVSFDKNYLYLVYILYVLNTTASYLWIPQKLFLIADQKNYTANTIQQTIHITQLLIQTLYLAFTHNFIGYLLIQIICTGLINVCTTLYVKKKYPQIQITQRNGNIPATEKKELTQNIGSIFFYKIGAVILNGTDNVIMSAMINTLLVGICSNFTLIINSVNSVLMQCFNGIGASIGNHIVTADKEKQEQVFCELNLFCVLIFSFSAICLLTLLNPFVQVWLGESYCVEESVVFALVLAFFFTGINQIPSLYRTSMGLFKEARVYPVFAAIANVILSCILAKYVGLAGIFYATSIVRLFFFTFVDGNLVYHIGFEQSSRKYYFSFLLNTAIMLIGYFISRVLVSMIDIAGVSGIVVKALICAIVAMVYLLLIYGWQKEFRSLSKRLVTMMKKRVKRA